MTTEPAVERIEADIDRTRAELAHTVDELAARLDVKTRAKERLQQTSPVALGAGAAAIVVVVALVIWRRSR